MHSTVHAARCEDGVFPLIVIPPLASLVKIKVDAAISRTNNRGVVAAIYGNEDGVARAAWH
jgi:hypothetical protein